MVSQLKFQIGKNGITDGVVNSLSLAMKNHKQVRISVLKSSGRTKKNIESFALELKERLPFSFDHKVIGFTLILFRIAKKHKTKSL
ncbi:MAG: YhbY family RNA-binding protein [Nanoarchaeota archaeon]